MSFCDSFYKVLQDDRVYVADDGMDHVEIFMNISRKTWPNWPGWVILDRYKNDFVNDHEKMIDELTADESMLDLLTEFFLKNVWKPLAQLALFDRTTSKLFDVAAQFGIKTAISLLQQAVSQLNPKYQTREEGLPDKSLLACIHEISNTNNGEQRLLECICEVQKAWCCCHTASAAKSADKEDILLDRAAYIPY